MRWVWFCRMPLGVSFFQVARRELAAAALFSVQGEDSGVGDDRWFPEGRGGQESMELRRGWMAFEGIFLRFCFSGK